MSLTLALESALSSLRVNQESISLISTNIANANSEGYTRRELVQSAAILNGEAAGAKIESVRRVVDQFLVNSARTQVAGVGRAEALKEFYDRTMIAFGEPSSNNSISVYIDDFFSGLSDLAANPEQVFTRNTAIERGVILTKKINELSQTIQDTRFAVDQEINNTVREMNGLLNKMFEINTSIKEASRLGGDSNALLDLRDKVLEDISKIIDVKVSFNNNGEVSIFFPRGEILTPDLKFQLQYTPSNSVDSIVNGLPFGAITVRQVNNSGEFVGEPRTLISATDIVPQVKEFKSGTLQGLIEMRDIELPRLVEQLDELAKTFTDTFNAIHNKGSGFPPAEELTGTRQVYANDLRNFSGKVRIAMLNPDGTPVTDPFGLTGGMIPLTIDLDRLDSGSGPGIASIQDIVDEINSYYGPPPGNKVSIGPLDDIRIAAVSSSITTVKASGTIAFTGQPGVGDTIVIDGTTFTFVAGASSGTNIGIKSSINETVFEIANHLNSYTGGTVPNATYGYSGSTLTITHDTGGTTGNAFTLDADVTNGGGTASINGGAAAANPAADVLAGGANVSGSFEFDFDMMNLSDGDATFEVLGVTVNNGAAGWVGAFDPYTAASGTRERTDFDGVVNDSIVIDLTGSTQGEGGTHTVQVDVQVTDKNGVVTTDTIDFVITIPDPSDNIKNNRFAATAVSGGGDAVITAQTTNLAFARASIVDDRGRPVATGQPGYLKLETLRGDFGIVIDELDSSEGGSTIDSTSGATNRGFSHFFGLNDFFNSSDVKANSAINFSIRDRLLNDPTQISMGKLSLSTQPSNPSAFPIYTYEVGIGSNQIANEMANLRLQKINFSSAGTIPALTASITEYSSEIISFAAFGATGAAAEVERESLLFDAFKNKIDSISGVNVDEELANTVSFQNNYIASTRLINLITELFDNLLNTF